MTECFVKEERADIDESTVTKERDVKRESFVKEERVAWLECSDTNERAVVTERISK